MKPGETGRVPVVVGLRSRLDQVNGSHTVWTMDGKTLKRRREALGYSQSELAALLHIHTMTVSRWERGQHKVPESVALVIKSLKPKSEAVEMK